MADDVTDNSQTDPNKPDPNKPVVVQSAPDQQLKDNGTDVNVALGMPTSVLPIQEKTQADIQLQEQQDELYAAVKRGDRVRVEELVDRGADVNRPDNNGTTAMMNAVENNDTQMSREFLQQKSNGNIAYDPTADVNLTGGAPVDPGTGAPDPNAPGTDNTSAVNVAAAVATGLTAEEAAAAGNYALAAQLEQEEELAHEALEQNDDSATEDFDGDMTYASTVNDEENGNSYGDDPYGYDGDDDMYGNDDPYGDDPYYADNEDPYGYDDYYGDDYPADDPSQPSMTASNTTPASPLSPSGNTYSDPSQGGFMSSFMPAVTDAAILASSAIPAADPTLASNFFDFSSPSSPPGQTVWNTQFFDPSALQAYGTGPSNTPTMPSIAPTNPYYKPSASSGMALG